MSRSPLRVALAEGSAVIGIAFGVWLIYSAFQPASNLPNLALVVLGALDILICFGLFSYYLRSRLREGEPLPRRWITGSVVLLAGFLGWQGALFHDADRLLTDEQHQREIGQQLARLDDSLRHMSEVMAINGVVDRNAWDVNYDQFSRVHDQLQASLRARPTWNADLTRIDEQVRLMKKAYAALPLENVSLQRVKLAGDFQIARERAVQQADSLRNEVAQSERDIVVHRRARWHGVGAGALAGIVMLLGNIGVWLVFDRALQKSRKALSRLADKEGRFRALIENDAEPLAIASASGVIDYANAAWQTALGREPGDLVGTSLFELIHADDRTGTLSAWRDSAALKVVSCRLSADYGVWHDVEMHISRQGDTLIVRIRDLRETSEFASRQVAA